MAPAVWKMETPLSSLLKVEKTSETVTRFKWNHISVGWNHLLMSWAWFRRLFDALQVLRRKVEECGPRLIWKWEWVWVINADFIPPWLIIQPNTKRLSSSALRNEFFGKDLENLTTHWHKLQMVWIWFYSVCHCRFFFVHLYPSLWWCHFYFLLCAKWQKLSFFH